jgi:hypothetical protein
MEQHFPPAEVLDRQELVDMDEIRQFRQDQRTEAACDAAARLVDELLPLDEQDQGYVLTYLIENISDEDVALGFEALEMMQDEIATQFAGLKVGEPRDE